MENSTDGIVHGVAKSQTRLSEFYFISSEYSGLISFRIDWFVLLAVQGTLKSRLQFKSISSSALSLFYGPTLTSVHDYWKEHSLDYIELCWESGVFAL